MSVEHILENWDEYEAEKRALGHPPGLFYCIGKWERDYLLEKIALVYPKYNRAIIKTAITITCIHAHEPQLRETFIQEVFTTLNDLMGV